MLVKKGAIDSPYPPQMAADCATAGSLSRLWPSTSQENRSGSSVGLSQSSRIGDHSERINSIAIHEISHDHHGDIPARRTYDASTPKRTTQAMGSQIRIQPKRSK